MASPTAPHRPESVFTTAAAAAAAAAATPNKNPELLGCRNVSWALPATRSAAFLPSSTSTSSNEEEEEEEEEEAAALLTAAADALPPPPPPPIDRPESVPAPERTVSGYCRFLFGAADVEVDDDDDAAEEGGSDDTAPALPVSIPLLLPVIHNNAKNKVMAATIASIKRARSLGLGGRVRSVDLTAVAAGLGFAGGGAENAAAAAAPTPPQPLPLPLPLPILPPCKAAKRFEDATAAGAAAGASAASTATATTSPPPPSSSPCPPPPPLPRTTRARSAAASRPDAPPRSFFGGGEPPSSPCSSPFSRVAARGSISVVADGPSSRSFPPHFSSFPSSRRREEEEQCSDEENAFRLAMTIQASSNPRVVTTGLLLEPFAAAALAA